MRILKKILFVLLIAVVSVGVVGVLVLGYFGFVPGLSKVFGSDKPRDLGVEHDSALMAGLMTDYKVTYVDQASGLESEGGVKFEGSVPVKGAFDSREMTAMMNHHCEWKYCMLTDAQVRANADGTVEVSGMVRFDRLDGYASRFDVPKDRLDQALDALKLAPAAMPIYVKGRPSGANEGVSLNIEKIELGRLPAPQAEVEKYAGEIDNFVESQLAQVPGFSMKSATFVGGELNFEGTHPQTVSIQN